jgi:hypothetical protein
MCALGGALTIGEPLIVLIATAAFVGLFLVMNALRGTFYAREDVERKTKKSTGKRAEHDEYLARKWMDRGKH